MYINCPGQRLAHRHAGETAGVLASPFTPSWQALTSQRQVKPFSGHPSLPPRTCTCTRAHTDAHNTREGQVGKSLGSARQSPPSKERLPLTSAQVMFSRFVSSSPTAGSQLSTQSPLQIPCLPLSLSLPLPHLHPLKINKTLKKEEEEECLPKTRTALGSVSSRAVSSFAA